MNERGHVVNAVVISIGVGIILEWSISVGTIVTIAEVTPPILLGALFPDIDTSFGTHRKTFHNVWVLGIAIAFPSLFNNLHFVWIGITTHYLLDLLGNVKGVAFFYPFGEYYDIPIGVSTSSKWADVVTLAVTTFELGLLAAVVYFGHQTQLAGPGLSALVDYFGSENKLSLGK